MVKRRKIKDGVEVVIREIMRCTTVELLIGKEKTVLCKVRGTNEMFLVDYGYNDNYVVVYSRGCMLNQIPLKIEAVYDITNKKFIKVQTKNRVIFEYMCISKKGFYVPVILEFLNERRLNIASDEEVDDFVRYVTASNVKIKKSEIKQHIFNKYPEFKKFTDLRGPYTVKEYRKLMREFPKEIVWLHIMPNPLREELIN